MLRDERISAIYERISICYKYPYKLTVFIKELVEDIFLRMNLPTKRLLT